MVAEESLHLLYHELHTDPTSYAYSITCIDFQDHLALFAKLQQDASDTYFRPEISFDDGHRSNFDLALPALAERRLKASFFLTAGWIAHKTGYMNWEHVRSLHEAGHHIGAHGMTHTLLTHCDTRQLQGELLDSRLLLEDRLGTSVTTMSLPGGRYNSRILSACQESGYKTVYTSIPRAATVGSHLVGRLNIRSGVTSARLEALLQKRSGALQKLERQDQLKQLAKRVVGDRAYSLLWSWINHQDATQGMDA